MTLKTNATSLIDQDGSALVLHAKPDDYRTDPSGAAGGRLACRSDSETVEERRRSPRTHARRVVQDFVHRRWLAVHSAQLVEKAERIVQFVGINKYKVALQSYGSGWSRAGKARAIPFAAQ
jgi:hypothetical protein